jgi:hypothetical protein
MAQYYRYVSQNSSDLSDSSKLSDEIDNLIKHIDELYSKEEMLQAMLFAFDTYSESLSRTEMELRANDYIKLLKK